jgi:predicted HTH domain antitoxin
MSSKGLTTALTLYRSGTLTLEKAAARAGLSESAFVSALRKRGISVDGDATTPDAGGFDGDRPARAD